MSTTKRLFYFAAMALIAMSLGCKDSGKKSAKTPESAKSTASAPAPAQLPTPLGEDEIRGRVESWAKAQNEGDFPGYIGQYATKFHGVKRVDGRTLRYDLKGWEQDRARMAKAPVTVKVTDLSVAVAADSAVATFTQEWTSGSFRDVGTKQLVFAKNDGEIQIVREEMLDSTTLGGEGGLTPHNPSQLAHVVDGQYVVLPAVVDEAWVRGEPRPGDGVDATTGVEMSKVPVEFRRWKGRRVTMFNAAGKNLCASKVVSLRVVARVTPHFSTAALWLGSEEGPAMAPETVAKQAFDLAGPKGRLLVAKTEKRCEGAVYATGRAEHPVYLKQFEPESAVQGMILNRFYETDAYVVYQKDFEQMGQEGQWDQRDPGPQFKGFLLGDKRYISFSVRVGEGCGEFTGEAWGIYEMVENRPVLLSTETSTGRFFVPKLAVDSDGDGIPEFLSDDFIFSKVGAEWRITNDVTVPYFDCPC